MMMDRGQAAVYRCMDTRMEDMGPCAGAGAGAGAGAAGRAAVNHEHVCSWNLKLGDSGGQQPGRSTA